MATGLLAQALVLWAVACTANTTGAARDQTTQLPAADGPPPLVYPDARPPGPDLPHWRLTHYDINHLLSTGQSLSLGSVGQSGTPLALSTTQPFDNVMFNTGVRAGGSDLLSFKPLVEAVVNHLGETISSGMANLVAERARSVDLKGRPPPEDRHDLLVSVHGKGGQPYAALKEGTDPFAEGMNQVKAALAICQQRGLSYVVRAVTNIHGEADHKASLTEPAGTVTYAKWMGEWQEAYQRRVQQLTGQSEPVPMLYSQVSTFTELPKDAEQSVPVAQLRASQQAPDRLLLVGPKYFLRYDGGVHLASESYRHLGEYYGKVYRQVVVLGQSWRPLSPKRIFRRVQDPHVIRIDFHVPVPPLVLDRTLVQPVPHFGFAYFDDSASPPTIKTVALSDKHLARVRIVLSAAPTGANKRISYAMTPLDGATAAESWPRGNLRDSDATPSRNGYPLHNWAVHFEEPVPEPE